MSFGCELHSDCFTCHFPDCLVKDNYTINKVAYAKAVRNKEILTMVSDGISQDVIAEKFKVCVRTIERVVKDASKNRKNQEREIPCVHT